MPTLDPLVRRWSMTIAVKDNMFEPLGAAYVPAGPVSIIFENRGRVPHELQIFQLEEGMSPADFMDATVDAASATDLTDMAVPVGGSSPIAGGSSQNIWVNLEVGAHVLVSMQGGTGSLALPIEVEKPTGEDAKTVKIPTAAATIQIEDDSMSGDATVAPGDLIRFDNGSLEPRDAVIIPGEVGSGEVDMSDLVGGVAVLGAGKVGLARAPAEPGMYTIASLTWSKGRAEIVPGVTAALRVE